MIQKLTIIAILVFLYACAENSDPKLRTHIQKSNAETIKLNSGDFTQLMKTVENGWNEGNAMKAANCFTEDAIYTEPPDKQLYKGRDALYQFFGGAEGRKTQMTMKWHHLVFNENTQVGAGEFTFEFGSRVHGVVMVKVKNGKISNWREYFYESKMDWETFIGENKF